MSIKDLAIGEYFVLPALLLCAATAVDPEPRPTIAIAAGFACIRSREKSVYVGGEGRPYIGRRLLENDWRGDM